jgi:hypothetical protein
MQNATSEFQILQLQALSETSIITTQLVDLMKKHPHCVQNAIIFKKSHADLMPL